MAKKVNVWVAVEPGLQKKLEDRARIDGVSQSVVVRKAVMEYLHTDSEGVYQQFACRHCRTVLTFARYTDIGLCEECVAATFERDGRQ